jgi:hypothetical protein
MSESEQEPGGAPETPPDGGDGGDGGAPEVPAGGGGEQAAPATED